MKKLKVAYFGTPDFSVPALELLYNHSQVELVSVISMPDRKAGRGYQIKSPEVIEFAKTHKIPFFQTQNINQEQAFLASLDDVDVFVVLAFAQFLNDKVLAIPKRGAFNIHTSLLPKYRGAAPIQYALLNGDTITGVSIQKMVKKMDAGDIACSHELSIGDSETGGQLYTRLKFQAALCLNDFISNLIKNQIEFSPQDETQVSFAPTLTRDDGKIDFHKPAETIRNQVRALSPWPGTYCELNGKRLKVFEISVEQKKLAPGELDISSGEILVGTLTQTVRLAEVQLEGKKRSSDRQLLNGIKTEVKLR